MNNEVTFKPVEEYINTNERFRDHLLVDKNFRILFSGKFGTGKTFFLNNFFDQQPDKYNKFIISPVKYIVNANEDIFELIKADIIRDMFFSKKIIEPKKGK